AYEVLSDPQKRNQYNRFGFNGVSINIDEIFSGGIPGIDEIFRSFFGDDFGFGGFGSFGRRGRTRTYQKRRVRGGDIEDSIDITFEESIFGKKKEIIIERMVPCDECEGTGAESSSNIKICPQCGGSGQMTYRRQTIMGTIIQQTTCSKCGGEGKIITKKCKTCKGDKVIPESKKLKITIPPGVEDGIHLKVQGAGHIPTRDAIPGELYIRINVKQENTFYRRNDDIYSDVNIDFITAILGDKIKVKTFDHKNKKIVEEDLRIPSGTQSNTEFRFKKRGVPHLYDRDRGDHYIRIIVEIPKNISEDQKELLYTYKELDKRK
ncbi:MAG: molecular chaperone DnaJ, partial [Candidatus Lokiarchaeota archaeon]|nr:molecular chaperone DnaJ [Candidatus Lokiarchaeota archaeon]